MNVVGSRQRRRRVRPTVGSARTAHARTPVPESHAGLLRHPALDLAYLGQGRRREIVPENGPILFRGQPRQANLAPGRLFLRAGLWPSVVPSSVVLFRFLR